MSEKQVEPVAPEVYNRFLGQLTLVRVRLVACSVETYTDYPKPAQTGIEVAYQSSFEPTEGGFEALAHYEVRFNDTQSKEVQAVIMATYGLAFASEEVMKDEIFVIFGDLNLQMNVWPFMREFVLTSMGRMDWPAFTLPLLKPAHVRQQEAEEKVKQSSGKEVKA